MAMETLEFIIYPDGRVQEKVTGIIGKSCEEITLAIETQLGKVISQEKNADYYNEKLTANNQIQNQNW
jgi:Protein of unknown function (DUF2997)